MSDFGHHGARLRGGGFVDSWGSGPFELEVAGKRHRFEDSDQFGPSKLNKNGEIAANPFWGARHPFWEAHRLWRAQGRRLAEDGITCVWSPGRPTIIKVIAGRHAVVVSEGDLDGATLDIDSPEGKAAIRGYGIRLPTGFEE